MTRTKWLLACLLAAPSLCSAQLTVCNGAGTTVNVSLQHGLITQGWFVLQTDKCKIILSGTIAGSSVAIFSTPETRVRGVVPSGGGGTLSWCASHNRFSMEAREVVAGRGCPANFYDANYLSYDTQWNNVTWTLELDPEKRMLATGARGGRRTRSELLAHSIDKPKWVAIKTTTQSSLTSGYGRKDKTFNFNDDPGFMTCAYRINELSSIGSGNHYELNGAYSDSASLSLSVGTEHDVIVGNGMAQIGSGDKTSLKVHIDWYSIYLPNAKPDEKQAAIREVQDVLSKGPKFLEAAENTPIRQAFINGSWPDGLKCFDRPSTFVRSREGKPAPIPSEFFPPASNTVFATLRVHCVRSDNHDVLDNSEHNLQGRGTTCAQARADAQSQYSKNICNIGHPYRTNGPTEWIDTPSCRHN